MSRLTRDGTAEPVSRDQILRHALGQGNIIFPVQLTTSRIGNLTRLIHTLLYVMTIHTYIHTVDPILLPSGNPFKCHEEVLPWQPMFPPNKRFDGMLRRLMLAPTLSKAQCNKIELHPGSSLSFVSVLLGVPAWRLIM